MPHSENRVLIRLDPVSKSRESPFYFHFHRLTSESVCAAGVGCNCGRHAILSASDTSAYAIVSGAMQKPSGGHVHVCARISERACTEPNNMQHEYSRYLWLQRIPIGRTFSVSFMLLACSKKKKTAYANVSGRTAWNCSNAMLNQGTVQRDKPTGKSQKANTKLNFTRFLTLTQSHKAIVAGGY